MDTPGSRIRAAREQLGLAPEVVAKHVGMSVNSYDDLELHHDEIDMCVSISALRVLCRLLGIRLATILGEPAFETRPPVDLSELVAKLRRHLESSGSTIESFEASVGWEIRAALESSEAAGEWNLDQFRAVSSAMGVDWREVLPA